MNWFTRKAIKSPVSNETQVIEAAKLWYVRWTCRFGKFSSETQECMEAFPIKSDAEKFAESLRAAFKLIRHTSGNEVLVTEKDHV